MAQYVGSLVVLFTAELVLLLAAVFAGYLVITALATALSPRASARQPSRSRVRRLIGCWVGGVSGAFTMVLAYGVAGGLLGVRFVISTSPEHATGKPFMFFAGAVVGAIQAWNLRDDYLHYRRHTDFRMWAAHGGSRPVAAAHGVYLAGWRRHAFVQALSFAIVAVTCVVLVEALNQTAEDFDLARFAAGSAVVVALLVAKQLTIGVWTVVRPDHELIRLCTVPSPRRTRASATTLDGYDLTRPGRWRSTEHRVSFRVAYLLEWCLRNMVGRFARDQQEVLVAAGCSMAESLRTHAVHADQGAEHEDGFRRRLFFALRLATARDPLKFVNPILEFTFGEPDPPPLPRRRAARVLENASGVVNQHWPSLKAVFAAIVLGALLILGKVTDALGLLK